MFERYTEWARRALFFARYEASEYGSVSIEPEHLLLGLLRDEENNLMEQVFLRAKVSAEDVRTEVAKSLVKQEKVGLSVEIPFSKDVKQILQSAATEADDLNSPSIEAAHLLLGILRADQTVAASILLRFGISIPFVGEALTQLQNADNKHHQSLQEFKVRIVASRRSEASISSHGHPGTVELKGFTVREMLARAFGVHESRIQLPAFIDETTRYDLSGTWPAHRRHDVESELIRFGIEQYFGVTVTLERQSDGREIEVLVVRTKHESDQV